MGGNGGNPLDCEGSGGNDDVSIVSCPDFCCPFLTKTVKLTGVLSFLLVASILSKLRGFDGGATVLGGGDRVVRSDGGLGGLMGSSSMESEKPFGDSDLCGRWLSGGAPGTTTFGGLSMFISSSVGTDSCLKSVCALGAGNIRYVGGIVFSLDVEGVSIFSSGLFLLSSLSA